MLFRRFSKNYFFFQFFQWFSGIFFCFCRISFRFFQECPVMYRLTSRVLWIPEIYLRFFHRNPSRNFLSIFLWFICRTIHIFFYSRMYLNFLFSYSIGNIQGIYSGATQKISLEIVSGILVQIFSKKVQDFLLAISKAISRSF